MKKPPSYNLEIIVPFQPIGPYIARGFSEASGMIRGFIDLFGGDSSVYENIMAITMDTISSAGRLADLSTKFPKNLLETDAMAHLNKNSLVAMFESDKVLTMKLWNGYNYKFVMMTNLTLEKVPTEDGVFRGTMQVQEMPVLSVTAVDAGTPPKPNRNWAATAINWTQGALAAIPIAFTGVKKAAGDPPDTGATNGHGVPGAPGV